MNSQMPAQMESQMEDSAPKNSLWNVNAAVEFDVKIKLTLFLGHKLDAPGTYGAHTLHAKNTHTRAINLHGPKCSSMICC